MKALTLHQPWASLVALGVKTIETRSWATKYRGPLAIHAGATMPSYAKRYVSGATVSRDAWGDWRLHFSPTPSAPMPKGLPRPPEYGAIDYPLPLGAIVATCTLVDVVPIGELGEETAVRRIEVGTAAGQPNLMLCAADPQDIPCPDNGDGLPFVFDPEAGVDFDASDYYEADVTDQLPYGLYEPGRFAWLLADVVAIPEPIPAKGKQGLWTCDLVGAAS